MSSREQVYSRLIPLLQVLMPVLNRKQLVNCGSDRGGYFSS